MSRSNPAKALNGVRTGHICDRCNKQVRTGDLVQAYATHYDRDGWVLRRVWCEECGETTIGEESNGADEAIVEAVFWKHQIVSVEVRDRN
jgi:hypothetical protein